jgi:dienelactone hydrolase
VSEWVMTRRRLLAMIGAAAAAPACAASHRHPEQVEQPAIPGFRQELFTADGHTRAVFMQGTGPSVLLLHELPGFSWAAILLAQRLVERGFRVYFPLLFGGVGQRSWRGYLQACPGGQFDCSDPDGDSRVIVWLRALAAEMRQRHPNTRMAAIGMCLTGAFPLALVSEQAMVAGILSQPALPLGHSTVEERRGLGLTNADVTIAQERRDARFLSLRFTSDALCPPERIARLKDVLGDRLTSIEIPSGGNHRYPADAHAVLSGWYGSEPNEHTRTAFEEVVRFLKSVL